MSRSKVITPFECRRNGKYRNTSNIPPQFLNTQAHLYVLITSDDRNIFKNVTVASNVVVLPWLELCPASRAFQCFPNGHHVVRVVFSIKTIGPRRRFLQVQFRGRSVLLVLDNLQYI